MLFRGSGKGLVRAKGDLMSLLVRLEDSFGIVPASDGSGLTLNPKAPHAPKAATAVKLWAEKRAARERRDRRPGIRGLESLAVAAPRISQPAQPNRDARLGGERRSLLLKLSFYSPLHAKAFPACPGSKRRGGLHGGTRQYAAAFPLITPAFLETARLFTPH